MCNKGVSALQRSTKTLSSLTFIICTILLAVIAVISIAIPGRAKSTEAIPASRMYVIVSGDVFGIKLYSDGILVVGTSTVKTGSGQFSPAEASGLRVGDIIKAIDGRRVIKNSDLADTLKRSDGSPIELLIDSDGKSKVVNLAPLRSTEDGKFRAGLWIRDSTAGIGTITYFDQGNLVFGGLGHGICDVDTGELIPLFGGDAVSAEISDIYKGNEHETGMLCGAFSDEPIGPIMKNTPFGVFGSVTENEIRGVTVPVAIKSEVKTGRATILSTVTGDTPKEYDIEIKKVYHKDRGTKNMIIEVTDPDLIAKTGGIIQGMSGSPILQNGMLVGAVTHVFCDDPTRGYGIFAQNMLNSYND